MAFILWNIVIVSGISGVLALLLVLADWLIANYGECEIDINDGKKKLKVEGGSSLLSLLGDNNLFIPSACGGRGSCGFCKVKVLEGGGPLLPTEKPYLSLQELKDNIRLSCQVKVKEDIKIWVPPELFAIKRFKAKVEKIEDYTYDIKGLTMKLIEPNQIDFKAGQYVQLETPPYEKSKKSVSRAYSISSNPDEENIVQLIIRRVPDGICTTYVHDYLKEGDNISFTGPFGDFLIQDTEADMFFIAGGSGKAPIKSMVEYLHKHGSKRRMVYFFGARTTKDLYLTEHFREFEKKLPDFTYVPVLSQPEEGANWDGRTGYVIPYLKEFLRDSKTTEAYLCGSPGMIGAVTKELKNLGITEDRTFYDSFA